MIRTLFHAYGLVRRIELRSLLEWLFIINEKVTVNAVRMVTSFFLRFLVMETFNNRATYVPGFLFDARRTSRECLRFSCFWHAAASTSQAVYAISKGSVRRRSCCFRFWKLRRCCFFYLHSYAYVLSLAITIGFSIIIERPSSRLVPFVALRREVEEATNRMDVLS